LNETVQDWAPEMQLNHRVRASFNSWCRHKWPTNSSCWPC